MKSLEIVNEKIVEAIYPRYTYTETIWDEEVIINKNELEQIKQDLEALEIIKNKNVNLIFIRHRIKLINLGKLTLEEALDGYNFANESLTIEELLKLKQWLKENE